MVVAHPLADWDALNSYVPPTVPPDDDLSWDCYRTLTRSRRGSLIAMSSMKFSNPRR